MAPIQVVPTDGFQITSTIVGDKSVTLKWTYGENIDETKIIKLMVFMNDVTVAAMSTPSNLSWTASYADYSAISLKTTTISNLQEGENMLFYLAVITNESDGIHTKYSSLTDPAVLIVSAPNPFLLLDVDGRDLVINGLYNLHVQYNGATHPNQDKIVFILLNSDVTPGHSIYEFTSDGNYISNTNSTYFTLQNLSSDVTYEVSGFLIRDGLISTLSNTRWIIATQKTGPPEKPAIAFNYPDGTVTLDTVITYGGVHTTVNMNLYSLSNLSSLLENNLSSLPLATEDITTALYGASLNAENFPYTYTETYSNSVFTYAQAYKVVYRTNTLIIGDSKYNSNFISDTFYLLKTPEPPTIQSCDSGNGYVNLTWSDGALYNSAVARYELSIDSGSAQIITVAETKLNGYKVSNNITGLNNGQTYSLKIRTVVPDLNNPGSFIYSAWSTAQVATPYLTAPALTLNISYAEADVNGKAMLSWTIPSTSAATGSLAIDRFEILRSINNGTYSSLTSPANNIDNYTDNTVANGTTYLYKIRIVTKTINYNNVIDVLGDFSSAKSIVPWSIPSAPVIALDASLYAAVGNHYIKIEIADAAVLGNGLNLHATINRPLYEIYLGLSLLVTVTADNLVSTLYKINNLVNDQEYEITVKGKYKDPNVPSTYNLTVASNLLTATPVYTDTLFTPRNIVIDNVDDNTATIGWDAPELIDTLATYNLSFIRYEVEILNSSNTQVVRYEVGSSLESTYSHVLIVNGQTYTAKVYAVYDGDGNVANGNQLVYSSVQSGTFTPFETYPVNNFALVSVSSGSATVTWDLDNGSFNSGDRYFNYYRIQVFTSSSSEPAASYQVSVDDFTGNNSRYVINSLNNGQAYTAVVSPKFEDPNTGAFLYNNSSPVQFTPYDIPSALVLTQASLDNDSVNLSWAAPNMSGLAFSYILSIDDTTDNSIPAEHDVASTETSYLAANLALGHEYEFKIRVRFSDPNSLVGSNPTYYVYNVFSSGLRVTPFELPTVGVLSGVAGNQEVALTFELDVNDTANDGIIGGLNVTEYGYKYRVSTTDNLTEGFTYVSVGATPSMPVTVSGLTNGTSYDFVYVIKTDNSVNPEGYGTILTSLNSTLISLKPFTNPTAPTNLVADNAAGRSVVLTWDKPANLGGMGLYGYDIYENGTRVVLNLENNDVVVSYTLNNRTFGETYEYYVIAKTQNSNILNEVVLVSSIASTTDTKIVFEAPKAVTGLEFVSATDTNTTDTIVFSSTFTSSIGLLDIKFRVYYYEQINNGENITYEYKTADIPVASASYDNTTGLYSYSITDFIGGKSSGATVYVIGTNPNNNTDILESGGTFIAFGSFDEPILSEFYVTELGDRYISVTINNLNLNFTNFTRYRVEFYRNTSPSVLAGTCYFNDMSVINEKIEKFDVWDNNIEPHGVIQNNVNYTIKAIAEVQNPVNGADMESTANIISSVTPNDPSVPVVSSIVLSPDNGLEAVIDVDSKGMDITEYMLVIIPQSGSAFNPPNDLVYKSSTLIPVEISDNSTEIRVSLPVLQTIVKQIVVMVKNANGWSNPGESIVYPTSN